MEFTVEERNKCFEKGDGVVIPSNVEHSARVLDKPTKAVDAWYPDKGGLQRALNYYFILQPSPFLHAHDD